MKGLRSFVPDGRYDLASFASDEEPRNEAAYGTFHGTHADEGRPCPPTGKSTSTDYVCASRFEGNGIMGLTRIRNDARAVRKFGWG